jgi:hypothetical protein
MVLGGDLQEALFLKFAEFEEKVKEVERARAIYRYALDHIPKAQVTGSSAWCNLGPILLEWRCS